MRNTTPYLVGFSLLVSGLFAGACGESEDLGPDADTAVSGDALVPCDLALVVHDRFQVHLVSASGTPMDRFEGTLSLSHETNGTNAVFVCPPTSPHTYRCERGEEDPPSLFGGAGTLNFIWDQRSSGFSEGLTGFQVEASNGETFTGDLEFVEGTLPQGGRSSDCHQLARVFDVTIQLEAAP